MVRLDIETIIEKYKSKSEPGDRYTSFDYCYNYFLTTDNLIGDLERSCLTLGFYLASWGMYRGSSFLLQKSVKHLESTIQYINDLDKSIWSIDVNFYNAQNINTIISIYNGIKERIIPYRNADTTLITKILLGVFGFIPAFDNNFRSAFSSISKWDVCFTKVNMKSLKFISDFYLANKSAIDYLSENTFTTDFKTSQKTNINYPKAKIIDMYGFTKG
jgi:hypothetical protein